MSAVIDHFNLPVSNLEVSERFYTQCLAILNLDYLCQDGDAIGYGKTHWAFGIAHEQNFQVSLHVAFKADSRQMVERFYQQALLAGGSDNGAPGLRSEYGEDYFTAYVLDPDQHNIEVVCRGTTNGSNPR